MYCTPCARLMKSITPNTSVSPAAIRNSSTPSCSPLSTCTSTRVMFMRLRSRWGAPGCHPGRRAQARRSGTHVPRHQKGSQAGIHGSRLSRLKALGRDDGRQFGARVTRPRPASLHRAILGVRVGVALEYLLVDLGLEFAVRTLCHLHQVRILDRVVVGV